MPHLYPDLIHKDPDSDYGASFPDFPGCFSAVARRYTSPKHRAEPALESLAPARSLPTISELYAMCAEALALHADYTLSTGATLPAPTTPTLANTADCYAVIWVELSR